MQGLKNIDELRKQLDSLQPIKPEYQHKLDKKFRLEFNYNSNHIEGNTLTYGETELLLIFGETKGSHDKREYDEMEAHDVAYERIKEWAQDKERPLTEMAIRNLNEIILVKPFWKEAITADGQPTRRLIKIGDYKEYPNSVRLPNGEIFDYALPGETPIQMGELIAWYRSEEEKKELHPVALAALLHYKFVRIHPFDDGNGRISRLLVNYVLLKNDLPPVIIKSANKSDYLHALHQADAGFMDEFVAYIAEQERWSLEISIKAAKGESIDEDDDFIKEIQLIKRRVTEKNNVSKSPILVYTIFKYIHNEIWRSIKSTTKYFDDLFSESKDDYYVNNMMEDFGRASRLEDIVIGTKKENPNTIKIFGHDIYQYEVKFIDWRQIKYGLRGSKDSYNYTINLRATFGHDSYKLELTIDREPVYSITKHYNDDVFLADEIEQLNNRLKKRLIEQIKNAVPEK